MKSDVIAFGPFRMDVSQRRLTRDGEGVEVSARYFDALALLASHPGELIAKERFIDEVWRGVPVTDEALTQGIRALRKALGDDAANPRYIETVPKHGYRFIAEPEAASKPQPRALPPAIGIAAAGTAGAAFSGVLVGIAYGLAASAGSVGGLSLLLVMILVTAAAATLGGVGIALGLGLGDIDRRGFGRWSIAGAAFGGLVMGAILNLLMSDVFALLLGRAPADISGGMEGALLGFGIASGAALARHIRDDLAPILAAIGAAAAGIIAVSLGGQMFGGSMANITATFADSPLDLSSLGALVGSDRFDRHAQMVAAALECAIFGAFLIGAIRWVRSRIVPL